MRIQRTAAILAAFGVLAVQTAAWGQYMSQSSSSGMFGSRTLGGTSSGGVSRNFATGSGQTGQAAQGSASALVTGLQDIASQYVSPTARFSREGRTAGQFVGSSSQEMQTFVGSVQAGQTTTGQTGMRTGSGLTTSTLGSGLTSGLTSGSSMLGGNRAGAANRTGGAARGTARGGQRGTTQVRVSIRVGFARPVVGPNRVSTTLVRRLSDSRRVQTVSPVEVVVQGRTATLRGVVATDYDRALAEQIARLEPGVGQVNNELVVAVVPPEPE